MKWSFLNLTFGVLSLACVACGDEDEEAAGIEIEGTWSSNFGGTETIDDDSWASESSSFTSVSEIVEFSNEDNMAITRSPDDGTYGRNVWTDVDGGRFYYCTIAFMQDSADAAWAAGGTPDATDPATSGCGGFSWTELTRQ